MAQGELIKAVTVHPLQQAWQTIVAYLPQILGALALLLVGWVFALVLRKLTAKVLRALGLDVIAERTGATALLARGGVPQRPSQLLGWGVYWLILFSALVAAFNALGLEVASVLLRAIVLYIPRLLVAMLLFSLGYFASRYVETLATATATALNLPLPQGWGRAAQLLVLLLASAMALSELGIATTIVSFGFIVFLGVAGSAAVVAFGLGTRDVAAQLAAGQCLRRLLRVGEVIQYGMYEGTVRELGLTHVVVESGDGLVIIPNTELLRATVVKRQAVPQAT